MASKLDKYILDHISPEDPLLRDLDRATHLNVVQPRMLSGHLQGEMLRMLTSVIDPGSVLELGTFTGYSAISIARALRPGAVLHTVEVKDELEPLATRFIEQGGYRGRIVQHIGSALEIVPRLDMTFDMVFIDADKREYPEYYKMLFASGSVASGSVILADNVLWNGKVVEEPLPTDAYTRGILEFNRMVAGDSRVEKVILPIRDGMTIIRVK